MNDNKIQHYEIAVVGGGPASLALGYNLSKNNFNDYAVFDLGKEVSQRNRYDEVDCISGIGGAGLFSDGKFSFYPSGTEIWKLKISPI